MPKIAETKRQRRFAKEDLKSFSFGNSLKSYDEPKLLFTNFVNSAKNENYCRLEKILIKSLDKDYSFLYTDFEDLEDINYTYKTTDRLLDIINKGYWHKYTSKDLKNIFKIKHRENSKFEIYLYQSRNNLTVLLIDFFHLAIPSYKYTKNGIIKIDLKKAYNKQSTNEWDIKNIL